MTPWLSVLTLTSVAQAGFAPFNFDTEVGNFNSANFFEFDRIPRSFLFASDKPANPESSVPYTISPIDNLERAFDSSPQQTNPPFTAPPPLTSTSTSTTTEATNSPSKLEDEQQIEEKSVFYEPFLILNVKENELEPEVNLTTESPEEETKIRKRHGGNLDFTGEEVEVEVEEEVDGEEHRKGGLVSYGGDSQKIPPKEPGNYGPATPNFSCEKARETLFVTESSVTSESKCFTVFTVDCSDIFEDGKDIGSRKECNQFTETKCRTVFDTRSEERCSTSLKKKCDEVFEIVSDWTYEQKCSTTYEQQCHGRGYSQECTQVPKEICKQVPKKIDKQVPQTKCKYVPERKCEDFPIHVPRKECREFPRTVCTEDAIQVTKQVPTKVCEAKPINKCITIPRQVNADVPKTIEKKLCSSTKPAGYVTPEPAYSPTYV